MGKEGKDLKGRRVADLEAKVGDDGVVLNGNHVALGSACVDVIDKDVSTPQCRHLNEGARAATVSEKVVKELNHIAAEAIKDFAPIAVPNSHFNTPSKGAFDL